MQQEPTIKDIYDDFKLKKPFGLHPWYIQKYFRVKGDTNDNMENMNVIRLTYNYVAADTNNYSFKWGILIF